MANEEPTCSPEDEEYLRKDGSYPSGHTAIGWAWALILSELAPDRIDAILARGRAFGESRVVCNVHWHSDVAEGRFIGASAVARLHADPGFRADLEAAKKELEAVRAKAEAGMEEEKMRQLAQEMISQVGAYPDNSIISAYEMSPALQKLPDYIVARAIEDLVRSPA